MYVSRILSDRRVLGEFQPRSHGKPEGEPIAGYFPAIIDEATWLAARAGAAQRRERPGRVGHRVNLFAGLVRDPVTNQPFYAKAKHRSRGPVGQVLLPAGAINGLSSLSSFPLRTFERAILSLLPQLNPAEALDNGQADPAPILEAELAEVKERLATIEAQLHTGDVMVLAKVARELEAKQKDLEKQLGEVKQAAAVPLADAWASLGEDAEPVEMAVPGGILPSLLLPPELAKCFQGGRRAILPALDAAADEEGFRLRLRSILRRVISKIELLVTADGADRLAIIQLQLVGDRRLASARAELNLPEHKRAWAIHVVHRPVKANANGRRPGRWSAWWGTPHDLTTAKGRAKALAALRELRPQDGDTFREGAGAVSEEIP
jgi:hypothetical protein